MCVYPRTPPPHADPLLGQPRLNPRAQWADPPPQIHGWYVSVRGSSILIACCDRDTGAQKQVSDLSGATRNKTFVTGEREYFSPNARHLVSWGDFPHSVTTKHTCRPTTRAASCDFRQASVVTLFWRTHPISKWYEGQCKSSEACNYNFSQKPKEWVAVQFSNKISSHPGVVIVVVKDEHCPKIAGVATLIMMIALVQCWRLPSGIMTTSFACAKKTPPPWAQDSPPSGSIFNWRWVLTALRWVFCTEETHIIPRRFFFSHANIWTPPDHHMTEWRNHAGVLPLSFPGLSRCPLVWKVILTERWWFEVSNERHGYQTWNMNKAHTAAVGLHMMILHFALWEYKRRKAFPNFLLQETPEEFLRNLWQNAIKTNTVLMKSCTNEPATATREHCQEISVFKNT